MNGNTKGSLPNEDHNDSVSNLTFGHLNVEPGLFDVTCSGLILSSPNDSTTTTMKKHLYNVTTTTEDERVGELCSCVGISGDDNEDDNKHQTSEHTECINQDQNGNNKNKNKTSFMYNQSIELRRGDGDGPVGIQGIDEVSSVDCNINNATTTTTTNPNSTLGTITTVTNYDHANDDEFKHSGQQIPPLLLQAEEGEEAEDKLASKMIKAPTETKLQDEEILLHTPPPISGLNLSLFDDTLNNTMNNERLHSTTNTRLYSTQRNNNNYNGGNISSLSLSHLSFANSTQFYSLAAGNLSDLSDDEQLVDDEDEDEQEIKENVENKKDDSFNSSSVEISEIIDDEFGNNNKEAMKNSKDNNNDNNNSNTTLENDAIHSKTKDEKEQLEKDNAENDNNEILEDDETTSSEQDVQYRELLKAIEQEAKEKTTWMERCRELEQQLKIQSEEKASEINKLQRKEEEEQVQNIQQDVLSPTSITDETDTISSQSDPLPNSQVEDLKLQIADLEKKLTADRQYLENQTVEREIERDEFQKTITILTSKVDEMKKEKENLEILVSNKKIELDDYEIRLKETIDVQKEVLSRHDKMEDELKSAVDKIHELRDIIRALEEQVDNSTQVVTELKDENKALHGDIEKLEEIRKEQEELVSKLHEENAAILNDKNNNNVDITEELQAQVDELATRIQRKLNDMDNFPWTRPDSSCSNNAISVSNEDISVSRDTINMNKIKNTKDVETMLADGLRKLDVQFESLVRFEEIIMKKLQDTELRLINAKKAQEDFENEKIVLQKKIHSQISVISDLENRLDQFRFEPSPNCVTLSGLRARVSALTTAVEELTGQLQLKEIEMQDLNIRLANKEALLAKLSMNVPESKLYPPVKKYNVPTQTEITLYPSKNDCFTQTKVNPSEAEQKFKHPKISKKSDASVQTKISKMTGYPLIEEETEEGLDLSSIQGPVPPTHSTPTDTQNSKGRRLHKPGTTTKFTDEFEFEQRSPEVLRDPLPMSRLNSSIISNKIPDLAPLKENEENLDGDIFDNFHPMSQYYDLRNEHDHPAEKLSKEGAFFTTQSTQGNISFVNESNMPGLSTGSGGGSSGKEQGEEKNGIGVTENINSDTVVSTTVFHNGKPLITDEKYKTRKVETKSITCQTPPLALINLIHAMDDEERKYLYDELSKVENKGQSITEIISNKNNEIQELLDELKELKNSELNKKSSEKTTGSQTSIIETPVIKYQNVETSMNDSIGRNMLHSVQLELRTNKAPNTNDNTLDESKPSEKSKANVSPVNWNLLEKANKERKLEADCKVETEVLKTQVDMFKRALDSEKQKCQKLVVRLMSLQKITAENQALHEKEKESFKKEEHTLTQQVNTLNRKMEEQKMKIQNLERRLQEIEQLHATSKKLEQLCRSCENKDQPTTTLVCPPSPRRTQGSTRTQGWCELFLRSKSHRKALAWQKKYLLVVVQGYKNLLTVSGVGFQNPDYLQKLIPITPNAIGLCDRSKPKARFKMAVRAVMIILRMKYMVNRWKEKLVPKQIQDHPHRRNQVVNNSTNIPIHNILGNDSAMRPKTTYSEMKGDELHKLRIKSVVRLDSLENQEIQIPSMRNHTQR